jgi:hypothetical protein
LCSYADNGHLLDKVNGDYNFAPLENPAI